MGSPARSMPAAGPVTTRMLRGHRSQRSAAGRNAGGGGRQVAGRSEGRKGFSEEAKRSLGRGRRKEGSSKEGVLVGNRA